jgi:nitroreductase
MNQHILESITKRRSIYAFDSKPIEKEKLNLIFEAAKWAPSPYNTQPWRFVFASKNQTINFGDFYESLLDFNRDWAATAPVLMVICARKNFEFNESPDPFYQYATGMAVGNLLAQLTELGLMAHQMGGFDKEKIRKAASIPAEYEPIAMMALGYEGDVTKLSENIQKKDKTPRKRKELQEFVFEGSWN